MRRRCVIAASLVAALAALGLVGCSDGEGSRTSTAAAPASGAALPALARRPLAEGEIVVRGESSPASYGPYAFDGRYVVRFEQYAPEDAGLDFTGQTPFAATLQRREGDPRGATALFEQARRSGRRELALDGRLYLEVSFGDFPFVLRFTPVARR